MLLVAVALVRGFVRYVPVRVRSRAAARPRGSRGCPSVNDAWSVARAYRATRRHAEAGIRLAAAGCTRPAWRTSAAVVARVQALAEHVLHAEAAALNRDHAAATVVRVTCAVDEVTAAADVDAVDSGGCLSRSGRDHRSSPNYSRADAGTLDQCPSRDARHDHDLRGRHLGLPAPAREHLLLRRWCSLRRRPRPAPCRRSRTAVCRS